VEWFFCGDAVFSTQKYILCVLIQDVCMAAILDFQKEPSSKWTSMPLQNILWSHNGPNNHPEKTWHINYHADGSYFVCQYTQRMGTNMPK
jgi:hypothetical protein